MNRKIISDGHTALSCSVLLFIVKKNLSCFQEINSIISMYASAMCCCTTVSVFICMSYFMDSNKNSLWISSLLYQEFQLQLLQNQIKIHVVTMLKLCKISNVPVKLADSHISLNFSFFVISNLRNCFAAYKTIRNNNTLVFLL